jgi:hypothetical protein
MPATPPYHPPMLRARQHSCTNLLKALIAALLMAAVACSSSTGDTSAGASPALAGSVTPPPVASGQIPKIDYFGLRTTDSTLDAEAASEDAVRPGAFATMLASDGFLGAGQRLYTGRYGPISRVVLRKWMFADAAGATAFLSWIRERPEELIGPAEPVDTARLPTSVSFVVHEPTGCCHEEVPIYLAAWRQDAVVWTVRASGPRITYDQASSLVGLIEYKLRDG